MVGGFPAKRSAPAKAPIEAAEIEFDEDGRRLITAPIVPASTRPPATYARAATPRPPAPKPAPLPPPPVKPAGATAVNSLAPKPLPAPVVRRPAPPPPVRKYNGSVPPGHAVNNKGEIVRFSPDDIPY